LPGVGDLALELAGDDDEHRLPVGAGDQANPDAHLPLDRLQSSDQPCVVRIALALEQRGP